MFEFHVSRASRDEYQFDQSLFRFNGNVVFANFHAARVFAQKMNSKRDLLRYPEQAVRASDLNAMGLIDEILHVMVAQYRQQVDPHINAKAMEWLGEQLGTNSVEETVQRFGELFPPVAVYRGEEPLEVYLAGESDGLSHAEISFEELLMLWLANLNPAFNEYGELFDDSDLEKRTAYLKIMAGLESFFAEQPGFGPGDGNLLDTLRAPARKSPHSLAGQLEYIRTRWSNYLGPMLRRLLSSIDFIAEENKASFAGPGPIEAIQFIGQDEEVEQYSPDKDWMPRLVLLARNAYVWLDQLSKRYQRPINTLDQIPDEELDVLAERGITGLWLIGLWQRSQASKRIKQMMGNPEAEASAYSLYDYEIASDLGGPEAMAALRQRAWQRGIRMASDMVPNHMAIDSRWLIQHPDWFLSLPYPPYPSYSFNGPDLCDDERVGVYLEDHYYDRSDAAVVFKRVDHWSGDTRYIYHGNDGTQMPWNDTAQLNYLKAEVREAVIQTILHVARQFPIIRFDAAMTLAKRHIQRLWFPEPGRGGDIASRAEHGLSKADFEAAMPKEFWREVVDRVAAEVPDTLLLAEAFWLLEGYFVRTLGMHRVYNSAFMHMLRDEDNDKYRQLIKNTVEFDPEILKRYVNFMSNPDEETAVAQFGKGDKYFGVVTVMATIPGLPMFGHGQFEGFHEKYGMEYRRAYYDETPDQALVDRHMREITPLLKRRYLFAEMEHFLLYDFYTPGGVVDENVLAYSNRAGDERSLVVYHNKFGQTSGWLRISAAYVDKSAPGDDKPLVQKTLAQGLGLPDDGDAYLIMRDLVSGLEYIRNCREISENGMYIELGAYQRHVFLDMRVMYDNEWRHYGQVAAYLGGRGAASIEEAIKEIYLQPLHAPFRALYAAPLLRRLLEAEPEEGAEVALLDEVEAGVLAFLRQAYHFTAGDVEDHAPADDLDVDVLKRRVEALAGEDTKDEEDVSPATSDSPSGPAPVDLAAMARAIRDDVAAVLALPELAERFSWPRSRKYKKAVAHLQEGLEGRADLRLTLVAWAISRRLGALSGDEADAAGLARTRLDEWLLGRLITASLVDYGLNSGEANRAVALLKVLVSHQDWPAQAEDASALLTLLLNDREVQGFLGVNRYEGVLWYNAESLVDLLHGLLAIAAVALTADPDPDVPAREIARQFVARHALTDAIYSAGEQAGYQVEKLLQGV